MRVRNIYIAFRYQTKDLFRNRIIIILLFVIPLVFYAVVWLTNSEDQIYIVLASVQDKPAISMVQREMGLIFIGLAATGFVASFVAMSLMQRSLSAKKRLILCGFKSSELIFAKLILIAGINFVLGIYISCLAFILMTPDRFTGMVLGFSLCGYIYGCYGLLIGSSVNRELGGILLIILLANIDVGWLQNPIYYEKAQHKFIIEYLPAFSPSQASLVSAFTDHSYGFLLFEGFLYGSVFLVLALIVFYYRTRIRKPDSL